MIRIDQDNKTLLQFADDLLDPKKSVYCNKEGKWGYSTGTLHKIKKFFFNESKNLERCCQYMIKSFRNLESKAVAFGSESADEQTATFDAYKKASQALLKVTKNQPKLTQIRSRLKRQEVGLNYRITKAHRGLEKICKADQLKNYDETSKEQKIKPKDYKQFELLKNLAQNWKAQELRFLPQERHLTQQNIDNLAEAARYPKFTKLLQKDPSLRIEFFNWALRDDGGIKEFIQFPAQWAELKQAFITQRAVYVGKKALSVEKTFVDPKCPDLGKEKHLTLPFLVETENGTLQTKKISVLDKSKTITFKNNWTLTVGEVIKIFSLKNKKNGDLEFFKNGIQNISIDRLAYFTPSIEKQSSYETVDLNKNKWWKQLPTFNDPITKEELELRYNFKKPLEPGQIVAIIRATRQSPNLNVTNSHGYFEFAVPNDEGKYELYTLGKFAQHFPYGWWENLWFLAKTVLGAINLDVNPVYNHRQHAALAVPLSKENGHLFLEKLKNQIISGLSGEMYFQFFWKNCTAWPQVVMKELLGDVFPDVFLTNLLELPIPAPLTQIFDAIKFLPKSLHEAAFRVIEFCLGSFRSLTI